ncbi:MAG: tyrosine-type recombinase/integrase [Burkholderiaceae bacterium]|nr:tyrosine-type recombinase/integrase [Burkholderiaceae bacterium]
MFENFFVDDATIARHREGPLLDERLRYLLHCTSVGATLHTQRNRARALLRVANMLTAHDHGSVAAERLHELLAKCKPQFASHTAANLINIARPWLKFIDWWDQPVPPIAFAEPLDRFVAWMRDERGLTACTVEQWRYRTANFLRWCEQSGLDLATLEPRDIDLYFVTYGAQRWSRISAGHIARMLRVFFKHAAETGACSTRLASSILSHRRYRDETLPYALGWNDVQRLIATTSGESELDVRDRAILLLLAVYGLRRGEVCALRLEDIDCAHGQLRIWRLKRRQPQLYPLVESVGQALTAYIDTVRPSVPHVEVFVGTQAPRAAISPAGIYSVVNRRLRRLGVQAAHLGPHSLRHACASKLLADGLTLKEIGDHLGHRSAASTSIYAKVDMVGLRQIGEFDLGDLQ